ANHRQVVHGALNYAPNGASKRRFRHATEPEIPSLKDELASNNNVVLAAVLSDSANVHTLAANHEVGVDDADVAASRLDLGRILQLVGVRKAEGVARPERNMAACVLVVENAIEQQSGFRNGAVFV